MKDKDVKEAERLISKFFDGATTLAEERRLYRLFGSRRLPAGLERYRPVFAAFGSMEHAGRRRPAMLTALLRSVCATAAALALVFGLTVYADFREERMLAQVYGGSYVIDNGRRIDDLGLIRADIENALGEADRIEKRLGSADVVNETEQDVLDGISDPATRRQVEMMLNE